MSPTIETYIQKLDTLTHNELTDLYSKIAHFTCDEEILSEAASFFSNLEIKRYLAEFSKDPFYQALENGMSWADIVFATPVKPKAETYEMPDDDADWIMPVLKLRKNIWENFPVCVKQIESVKGAERYAIHWHMKNYQEQRNECEHGWQYLDFEETQYRRLFKALEASRYWTVSDVNTSFDTTDSNEPLCIITMTFDETKPAVEKDSRYVTNLRDSPIPRENKPDEDGWIAVGKPSQPVAPAAPAAPAYNGPKLVRLNDIKAHFPVVWHEVNTGNPKVKIYAIELFGKTIREKGLNANTVKAELITALKHSKSWKVLAAGTDREVARIEMNHL